MARLTQQDKRVVKEYINKYVQNGGEQRITLQTFHRTQQWSEGYTFAEIAEAEGVSAQAVQFSVKKAVDEILTFAEEYDHGTGV